MDTSNNAKIIAAAAIGLAVGGILGILFAPAKGSETRKKITEKGKDLTNSVKEKFNSLLEEVKNEVDSVKEEAIEYIDN